MNDQKLTDRSGLINTPEETPDRPPMILRLVDQEALIRQAHANVYADAKAVFSNLIRSINKVNESKQDKSN